MGNRKATFVRHAWRMLRMALLWARKGGALRRRLMLDLHQAVDHLRRIRGDGRSRLQYGEFYHRGETELSFKGTPTFQFGFKVRLPSVFPCINGPDVDGDYRVDDDYDYVDAVKRSCCFVGNGRGDDDGGSKCEDQQATAACSGWEHDDQEGIDAKAEEFIERFYQQMKLQRQISSLEYNEMLHRGMS